MPMKLLLFFRLALLVGVVNITSCCKTEKCAPGYLQLVVVGFSRAECDTIILTRYQMNSGYSRVIDSFLLGRFNEAYYSDMGVDTFGISIFDTAPFNLTVGHDYELFFPATGTRNRVSDIIENSLDFRKCLISNKVCYNDVVSHRTDGMTLPGFRLLIRK
jgi:hypothetical protein